MNKYLTLAFAVCFALCGCQNQTDLYNAQSIENTKAPKTYRNYDKNESLNYDVDLYSYDEEGNKTSTNYDAIKQIARAEGKFITVDDYYIETDYNKPLNPTGLSNSQFEELQKDISAHNFTNDWFRLYHLNSYDEWVSFREFKDTELASNYYCIMENQLTKERIFLFFNPMEETYYCMEYMVLDKIGNPKSNENTEFFCQTEQPEFWLAQIADCDLIF